MRLKRGMFGRVTTSAVFGILAAGYAAVACFAPGGYFTTAPSSESGEPSDSSSYYGEASGGSSSYDYPDGLGYVIPPELLPDVLGSEEYLPTPEDNATDPGALPPPAEEEAVPPENTPPAGEQGGAPPASAPQETVPQDTVPPADSVTPTEPYVVRVDVDPDSHLNLRSSMELLDGNIVAKAGRGERLLCDADCIAADGSRWRRVAYGGASLFASAEFTVPTGEDPGALNQPPAPAPPNTGSGDGWREVDGKTYYYVNGAPVTGWQVIAGVRHLFDENGVKISKTGIDVSRYQLDIDWQAVKEAGIDFAIIRVGYRGYGTGKIVLDDYFKKNMDGAAAVGIPVGVYFYSTAINTAEAVEEADFVLAAVKDYSLQYPVMFDIEHHTDRCAGVSREQFTDNTIAFLERIKSAGYKAMYYTYKSYLQNFLDYDRLRGYDLWLATYVSLGVTDDSPVSAFDYKIWQYSSDGSVPGVPGRVDMNIQTEPV